MNELLPTVKEVQEGGKKLANYLLARGYILLDIQGAAKSRQYNPHDEKANAQQYYVHRNPVYVLGRPEGVEPAEPLLKREIDNEPEESKKEILEVLNAQHQAIDFLFARLVEYDKEFLPSKSGLPWEAVVKGNALIQKLNASREAS